MVFAVEDNPVSLTLPVYDSIMTVSMLRFPWGFGEAIECK